MNTIGAKPSGAVRFIAVVTSLHVANLQAKPAALLLLACSVAALLLLAVLYM